MWTSPDCFALARIIQVGGKIHIQEELSMPNSDSKTYIVNDQATEIDALDFAPYVETLADIIQTDNTPLTIGVFGTRGSGKTSLIKYEIW